jgi:hypothetical protein
LWWHYGEHEFGIPKPIDSRMWHAVYSARVDSAQSPDEIYNKQAPSYFSPAAASAFLRTPQAEADTELIGLCREEHFS